MSAAMIAALVFTVVLLVTTAYFLMGGLPLLILQHDTPVDARFVRGFFNVYYRAAFCAALGAAASYALWGRFGFAFGAAAIALVAAWLRARLLPMMQQLGTRIEANDSDAIHRFRRMHATALFINLVQLVALVWSITKLSL